MMLLMIIKDKWMIYIIILLFNKKIELNKKYNKNKMRFDQKRNKNETKN